MRRELAAMFLVLLLLCQLLPHASTAAILADGPTAFWPLDEPAGSTVAGDLSGNGHYGTLSSGVTAGAAGPPTGDGTTAMAFHGADAVTVASMAGLPSGAHPASLEAWVDMAGGGAAKEGLVGYGNYGSTRQADLLRTNGWAGLFTSWWNDDLWANGSATLIGGWHLAVATYDGHARRLYLDGAPFAADAPSHQPAVQLLNLALGQTGGGDYLTGSLANVAIYPYALSPARIARHYALGEHSPAPIPTTSVLQYSYDGAGRLNSIVYPDGGRENHSDYDPAGRITHISLPDYTDYYLSYNAAGQRTQLAFPNGGKEYWAYDAAGRPHDTWWAGPGVTVPFTQTATLDKAGQRTVLQDTAGTTTYGYDGAGRLTSAGYPDGSTEANSYDQLGDRTTITSTTVLSGTAVTTNSFDAAAQLNTSVVAGGGQPGTTTYGYDGNGNQTGSAGPAGTVVNTFNQQDQLTHVSGPATSETFVYDGQGDRLRAYDQSTANYQLHTLVQDLRPGGMSGLLSDGAADYGYADFGVGAAPIARMDAGSSQGAYLASDLLGSVRLATTPSDQTLGSATYDAWGNAKPNTADAAGQVLLAGLQASAPFGYAGQQYDAGPGTYAMRARQYDPAQGRFQSADPQAPSQGYPVTLNPYQYAGDMVTKTTDPSGQWWVPAGNYPGCKGNDPSDSGCAGNVEQHAEDQIVGSFYGATPPDGPRTTNQFGETNPSPQLTITANVPFDVLFAVPVATSLDCKHARASLMANILSTGQHQVWDIEQAGAFRASPTRIERGVKDLVRALHEGGYFLPKLATFSVPTGARSAGQVPLAGCNQGVDLFGCNGAAGRVDGPYADPAMVPGTTGIDAWFGTAAADGGRSGVHHLFRSTQGPGTYEWWVQEPGLILWQASGDVGTAGGHYTNGALNAIDIVLGGSLSGGQDCKGAGGCGASVAWLAFNLGFAKQAGVALARGGALAGRLGSAGLRAFVARGGAIRLTEASGEHLLPSAEVTLTGQSADQVLAGLACPVRCFPAGTLVATPNGSTAIERLRIGDAVLAEDPATGTVEAEPVQAVIVRRVTPLLAVDLSDGSSLRVTDNHRFWVDGGPGRAGPGWVLSGLLKPGDRLRTADGKDVVVLRVRWNQGEAVVYTLTVARDHTFFVGAARVLVHNDNGTLCPGVAITLDVLPTGAGTGLARTSAKTLSATGFAFDDAGNLLSAAQVHEMADAFYTEGLQAAFQARDIYLALRREVESSLRATYGADKTTQQFHSIVGQQLMEKITIAVSPASRKVAINYISDIPSGWKGVTSEGQARQAVLDALQRVVPGGYTVLGSGATKLDHAEINLLRNGLAPVGDGSFQARIMGISNPNVCPTSGACTDFANPSSLSVAGLKGDPILVYRMPAAL